MYYYSIKQNISPMKIRKYLYFLTLLIFQISCNDFEGNIVNKDLINETPNDTYSFDDLPPGSNPQLAEYSLKSRWQKNEITYYIHSYSTDLPTSTQDQIFKNAFDTWSAVTPLIFSKVNNSSQADIIIGFGSGRHCDLYQVSGDVCKNDFDGPNRNLAHCYFPGQGAISGDAHFDEDEFFVEGYNGYQIDLLSVAVHELGHGLGLGHSDDRNAIMFKTYNPNRTNASLGTDDILGIQELYGPRGGNPPLAPPPRTNPNPPTNSCGPGSQNDTDGDQVDNYTEIYILGTNPGDCDTDKDGLPDNEAYYGINPLNPDTDGDGISDGQEVSKGTNPLVPNTIAPSNGSTIIGHYAGQDSYGSPLGFTINPDGSAQGAFRILYFGVPTDIPLMGGINSSGILQLVSFDYYFSFVGNFITNGAQGSLQTLDGGNATWTVIKSAGGRTKEKPASELVNSNIYQPANNQPLKKPHPVHVRVSWKK